MAQIHIVYRIAQGNRAGGKERNIMERDAALRMRPVRRKCHTCSQCQDNRDTYDYHASSFLARVQNRRNPVFHAFFTSIKSS
jgi:hypothetical protein